jgi:hypothetical protein
VTGAACGKQEPDDCGAEALAALLRRWGRPAGESREGSRRSELRRCARRAGLVALELEPLEAAAAERLLEQGVPILVELELGRVRRHYVLLTGRDKSRDHWVVRDGRGSARAVSSAWLSERWERRGRWALVAFPPERPVEGLGPAGHLEAADLAAQSGRLDAARWHLGQAGLAGPAWAAKAALRRAELEKAAGRPEAAALEYRKALELEPKPAP